MPAALPLAAAAIGGVISAVGSSKAAKAQASGQRDAAAISERQYQQTRQDQLRQYKDQRTDTKDYRAAGKVALKQLAGGTKAGGEFNTPFGMEQFQADPGYQFRQEQGEQGINRAATASGARYSGATLKALSRFNSGLASQEYGAASDRYNADVGSRFGRLSALAGIGQSASQQTAEAGRSAYGQIAAAGQNNANNGAASARGAGDARASGYVGMANALNGTIGGAYNNYQQGAQLSALSGVAPAPGSNPYDGFNAASNGGWGIE